MTFLNWFLLGGIAAVSIPIIIHFFHKSRFRVVKWGAMHLLESMINTNQRRLQIEQIILLIIRAALDTAARILGQMHNPGRDVILMSDFQRASWRPEDQQARAQILDRLQKMPVPPKLTLFEVGSETTDNVAVESLDFSQLMVG